MFLVFLDDFFMNDVKYILLNCYAETFANSKRFHDDIEWISDFVNFVINQFQHILLYCYYAETFPISKRFHDDFEWNCRKLDMEVLIPVHRSCFWTNNFNDSLFKVKTLRQNGENSFSWMLVSHNSWMGDLCLESF